jgi:hypothetical protein
LPAPQQFPNYHNLEQAGEQRKGQMPPTNIWGSYTNETRTVLQLLIFMLPLVGPLAEEIKVSSPPSPYKAISLSEMLKI